MDKFLIWLKRPQVWGFFVSVAVMAAIATAFFYPDNFDGNSLMQQDMQQGAANGHEIEMYQQEHGEKPMWTNSLMSGMPAFQISPTYSSDSLYRWIFKAYGLWLPAPSNLLFMMMIGFFILLYCMRMKWPYALIGAIAWGFSSYFVIIIGAGHLWKFMALTFIPPTIGGLIMCYRGRWIAGGAIAALFAMMQLAANHPQMSYYFAFVMAILAIAFLVEAISKKRVKNWIAATAILIGAGVLAVCANLPSLYHTYEYSKETKRSQSELTPIGEVSDAQAERPTGGLPREQILYWSYGTGETFSLLVPNVRGGGSAKPVAGRMMANSLAELEDASKMPIEAVTITVADQQGNPRRMSVLQYFSQYFNDSEGTNGPVYVGALICALFLLGCIIVRGPIKWALLVSTIISVLLAWGYNMEWLSDWMIYNFPMYSKFRAVESILVVAEFTMPLLAILALYKFLVANKEERRSQGGMKPLYWSFGICFGLCLLGLIWPGIFGSAITSSDRDMLAQLGQVDPSYNQPGLIAAIEHLRYGMVRSDCLRSLTIIGLGFIVIWMCANGKLSRPVCLAAVGVLVLFDLYTVDKRYVSSESFVAKPGALQAASQYDPFTPDAFDRQILQDTALSYRVMDIPGFNSATRSYHHKMIGGYHAAKLNRYEDLIQRALQPTLSAGYLPELRIDSIANLYSGDQQAAVQRLQASYRVLDMLNAKYIITPDDQPMLIVNDYALGNAWFVDEMEYAQNADQEMADLLALNPGQTAVSDAKFESILGPAGVLDKSPADSIKLIAYAPHKLTYESASQNGGVAVFSEIYFPWGWKATIDGNPAEIGRVDYVLRAMRLPAGNHTIEMVFDPESLHVCMSIAYGAVSLIYLWVIAACAWRIMRKEDELD